MPRAGRDAACAAGLLLLATGCGSPSGEPVSADEPGGAALSLLALAATVDDISPAVLDLVVEPRDSSSRVGLQEALDALARVESPRVVGVEYLGGVDRAVVDLQVELRGGGTADYSLGLIRLDRRWRADWIAGPEVSWPPRRRPPGAGLASSPGPGPPG